MVDFRVSEIKKIDVGILDAKTSCEFSQRSSPNPGGGVRGEIRELSRQSRTRLLYKARNVPGLGSMVTFTYPHEDYAPSALGGNYMEQGEVVKNHLRKLRQWFTYRDIYGFWFLEFQARGAPHFHFCINGELSPKDADKLRKVWSRIVGTACPHHPHRGVDIQILRKKHAAGAYAAKYSSKSEQKTVPDRYRNVGRFWGLFGKIPSDTLTITTSMKELYTLVRIAKRAIKADARARGYKARVLNHRGYAGVPLRNAGPALRYYLQSVYTIQESPAQIQLKYSEKHTIAFEYPW